MVGSILTVLLVILFILLVLFVGFPVALISSVASWIKDKFDKYCEARRRGDREADFVVYQNKYK